MALWGVGQAATKLLEPVPGWEVGGWIGSRADALLCRYGGEFLRGLRTTEPALNRADKERATREAYLVATVELVRRAELRKQVGSSGQRLRTAGTGETLAAMRRGVEADFQNVGITLPQPLRDVELLLEPERAPEEWRERIRETLRGMLRAEGEQWTGGAGLPEVVEDLLREGWRIDTEYQRGVARDWDSLIALAFVEKLGRDERMRNVWQTGLLADAAAGPARGGGAGAGGDCGGDGAIGGGGGGGEREAGCAGGSGVAVRVDFGEPIFKPVTSYCRLTLRNRFFVRLYPQHSAVPGLWKTMRTTDTLRPGRMGEFLASWCRACAACALFGDYAHNGLASARLVPCLRGLCALWGPRAQRTRFGPVGTVPARPVRSLGTTRTTDSLRPVRF